MNADRRPARRRLLRACGTVGVIGLAGCISSDGSTPDSGSGPDESPDIDFPPGLSSTGIDDVATLLETHRSEVMSTSFTYQSVIQTRETDQATDERTIQSTESVEIRAEPEAERVEKVEYNGPPGEGVDERIYRDGDRIATTGSPAPDATIEVIEASFDLFNVIDEITGEYVGTGTLESVPVHEIDVTALETVLVSDDPVDEGGTIHVDENGRIRRSQIYQTDEREGMRFTSDIEFEFGDFGTTTVEEPAWVDELAERTAIEPGTRIELKAEGVSWVGHEPSEIDGVENPMLVLEGGESYTIGWSAGEGAHGIEIRDENDEVVDDYTTEVTADGQWLEFTASEETAEYVCDPHAGAGMRGDIEIR